MPAMVAISKSNRRVRELRKLLRNSRYRDETKTFVIEGQSLLEEAASTGNAPIDVFVEENESSFEAEIERHNFKLTKVWHLDAGTLKSIASTQNPQPVLATMPMMDLEFHEVIGASPRFLVVGVEISDPGNAGTIIRTAAAAGADGVVFSKDSVDIFNPKVVRASAGSIFRIPVVRSVEMKEFFQNCNRNGIATLGLCGKGEFQYDTYDLDQRVALLVGNESRGLKSQVRGQLTAEISIPMEAGVESLNAASALSIVSFELRRQRASNDD